MICWVFVVFLFIFFQGDGEERSYRFSWIVPFQKSWRHCSPESDLILWQHNSGLNALETESLGLTENYTKLRLSWNERLAPVLSPSVLSNFKGLKHMLKIDCCVKCSPERGTFLKSKSKVRSSLLEVKCSPEGWCGQIFQLNLGYNFNILNS